MQRARLSNLAPPRSAKPRLAPLRPAPLLAGCSQSNEKPAFAVAGGDPDRAPALIENYGCGTCHRIPGIKGAQGGAGPPLIHFAERAYVAGMLPNTPVNLMHWIRNPQSVVPGNAMPEMGVTEQDARDIAAYLLSTSKNRFRSCFDRLSTNGTG
jgi:cytochrome c